jgi:hypothetical protein
MKATTTTTTDYDVAMDAINRLHDRQIRLGFEPRPIPSWQRSNCDGQPPSWDIVTNADGDVTSVTRTFSPMFG